MPCPQVSYKFPWTSAIMGELGGGGRWAAHIVIFFCAKHANHSPREEVWTGWCVPFCTFANKLAKLIIITVMGGQPNQVLKSHAQMLIQMQSYVFKSSSILSFQPLHAE